MTAAIIPRVFIKDGTVFANSRDVAAYFGKNHADVLRDIRGIRKSADPRRWFTDAPYIHPQNSQSYPAFDMTRDGFTLLVMGYTGPKAMEFKIRYIEQFNAIEADLRNRVVFQVPQTMPEALRLAADLVEKNAEQAHRIEEDREYTDLGRSISNAAKDVLPVGQAAKIIGTGKWRLMRFLRDQGWFNLSNHPYQSAVDAGYLRVFKIPHKDKFAVVTVLTEKGFDKAKELWDSRANGLAEGQAVFLPSISHDEFADVLRRYLRQTGLTPVQLGKRAVGDANFIGQVFSGKRSPTLKTVQRVLDYIERNPV